MNKLTVAYRNLANAPKQGEADSVDTVSVAPPFLTSNIRRGFIAIIN